MSDKKEENAQSEKFKWKQGDIKIYPKGTERPKKTGTQDGKDAKK